MYKAIFQSGALTFVTDQYLQQFKPDLRINDVDAISGQNLCYICPALQ